MVEYLQHLFQFDSNRSTAKSNRNAPDTGDYWLKKVFLVLERIQDTVVLSGDIYIDETYFPKKHSDLKTKDGKKLRGLSSNQMGLELESISDNSNRESG